VKRPDATALSILAAVVGLAVLAAGCGKSAPEGSAGRDDHGHEEEQDHAKEQPHGDEAAHSGEGTDDLAVALDGIRGLRLVEAPPRRSEGAWFPGEAIGDENAQAVLAAPVSGIVLAPLAPPQAPVDSGVALVTLASPELADLEARLLTASARRRRAEAALAREERLAAGNATSARELEEARSEAAVARAEEEAARLGLASRGASPGAASGRFVVRAPARGSVVEWKVRVGQGVAAGEELGSFQSGAASLVLLELPLPGPEWKLGDETEVRASDGRRWRARVSGVPALLGAETRRLSYRLRLTGGPLPIPGKPVEVRVPFAAAVILPQNALQQVEGSWGVFVKGEGHAHFRPVKRGTELGGDVMVLDGLEPGETVVTDGAYLLKAALLKTKSGGDAHDH
jgi:cobalt-zinc-cadmium efflux system membrane fusion protein